ASVSFSRRSAFRKFFTAVEFLELVASCQTPFESKRITPLFFRSSAKSFKAFSTSETSFSRIFAICFELKGLSATNRMLSIVLCNWSIVLFCILYPVFCILFNYYFRKNLFLVYDQDTLFDKFEQCQECHDHFGFVFCGRNQV